MGVDILGRIVYASEDDIHIINRVFNSTRKKTDSENHSRKRKEASRVIGKKIRIGLMALLGAVLFSLISAGAESDSVLLHQIPLEEGREIQVYLAPSLKAKEADMSGFPDLKENGVEVIGKITEDDEWWQVSWEGADEEDRFGWIRIRPTPEDQRPGKPSAEWIEPWEDYLPESLPRFDEEGIYHPDYLRKSATLMALTEDAEVLASPEDEDSLLQTLPEGAPVRMLWMGEGDWLYILTEADGQPACGFIPAEAAEAVPLVRMDGFRLIIEEGVEFLGVLQDNENSTGLSYYYMGPAYAAQRFGMVALSYEEVMACVMDEMSDALGDEYDDYSLSGIFEPIESVTLPGSLRLMGDDALAWMTLDELVIPEGVEAMEGVFSLKYMTIGTISIPSTMRNSFYLNMTNCRIGKWEIAKENPWFRETDGVLFSADGKKLLAYPYGDRRTHYDVPKGTETIGVCAFCPVENLWEFDEPGLQLRTISLPMGLKKIESMAFAGCVHLISITVPPTVTEIAEYAFENCVSLERISLPKGFRLDDLSIGFAQPDDHSRYTGDNGETITIKNRGDDDW